MVPQSPLAHVTSHAHAPLQLIVPHAPAAVQLIEHRCPLAQWISPHAPVLSQVTTHWYPDGQVMSAPLEPSTVHVGGTVVSSHMPVHTDGQLVPTHQPSMHTRPLLQSLVVAHAKSLVLRCTAQPSASTATPIRDTRCIGRTRSSRTDCLPSS